MTTITNSSFVRTSTPIHVAHAQPPGQHIIPPRLSADGEQSPLPSNGITLVQYRPEFASLVGDTRYARLFSTAQTSRNPFFYAGCTYVTEPARPGTRETALFTPVEMAEVLYVMSDVLQPSSSGQLPVILISHVRLDRDSTGDVVSVAWAKLRPPPNMAMPAGATAFGPVSTGLGSSSSGVLYCAQGSLSPGTSGLFYMAHGTPPVPLLTGYCGRDFNSVRDVTQHPADRSLWFTDPCIGFEHDFRRRPQLPCHVYRFNPITRNLRVVADGLRRPTALCLSADGATLYVADMVELPHGSGLDGSGGGGAGGGSSGTGTGSLGIGLSLSSIGNLGHDSSKAAAPDGIATIYAFDVLQHGRSAVLANRRVFAHALQGDVSCLRSTAAGHVLAGCGDGIEVWDADGALLGVIAVPGGVTSFCAGQDGELFLGSGQQLWWLRLRAPA